MLEIELVSEGMKSRAHILQTSEVCWGGADIEAALREIADAGQVILGFAILEPLSGGKLRPWGTSAYKVDAFLHSKSWDECVALALDLAVKDARENAAIDGAKRALF